MNIGIFIYSYNLLITIIVGSYSDQVVLYLVYFAMGRNATVNLIETVFDPTRCYGEFHPCDFVIVANSLTGSFNN